MPKFFQQPPAAPNMPLPQEAPNRPLGADWLSDAVDGILGGLGIANPFSPSASKAVQLGGIVGAALPFGKLGKAAQDLHDGLTLPQAQNALSDTRMGEFLASHGGTAGVQPSLQLPAALPAMGDPQAHIAPPQTAIAPRPAGNWDTNAAPKATYAFTQPGWGGPDIPIYNVEGGPLHQSSVSAETLIQHGIPVPAQPDPIHDILKQYGIVPKASALEPSPSLAPAAEPKAPYETPIMMLRRVLPEVGMTAKTDPDTVYRALYKPGMNNGAQKAAITAWVARTKSKM